jgi:hypothetical protein
VEATLSGLAEILVSDLPLSVRRFSWRRMAEQMVALYASLV